MEQPLWRIRATPEGSAYLGACGSACVRLGGRVSEGPGSGVALCALLALLSVSGMREGSSMWSIRPSTVQLCRSRASASARARAVRGGRRWAADVAVHAEGHAGPDALGLRGG